MRFVWGLLSMVPLGLLSYFLSRALFASPDMMTMTMRIVSMAVGVVIGIILCLMFIASASLALKGVSMMIGKSKKGESDGSANI